VQDTQPYELKFKLYKLTAQKPRQLVYETQLQTQPGIMQLTLPQDQFGLTIGERYEWQVIMICDPNSPSQSAVASAEMEAVALPAALKPQLAVDRNSSQVYAEAGFWYDALAAALQSDSTTRPATIALLEDLAVLEAQAARSGSSSGQWAEQLQEVVAIERDKKRSYNQLPTRINGAQ
jgi:hypothetical protein